MDKALNIYLYFYVLPSLFVLLGWAWASPTIAGLFALVCVWLVCLIHKVRRGYSDRNLRLPVLALLCNKSAHSHCQLLEESSTLARITGTAELAPYLCYTIGIRYPTHKIADGAIPTSYTRPTWIPHFWSKHLEKFARPMLNNTKCKRVWTMLLS